MNGKIRRNVLCLIVVCMQEAMGVESILAESDALFANQMAY